MGSEMCIRDRCGAPGDYLSWEEEEWTLHSAARMLDMEASESPLGTLLEWRTLAEELWRYRDTEIEKYRRASRLLWLSGTEGSAISVYVTI